ncbi:MAG: GC-type dockerin domain-anchored protein [Phycisphaerales bacterium]
MPSRSPFVVVAALAAFLIVASVAASPALGQLGPAFGHGHEPCATRLSEETGRRHAERERLGVLEAALRAFPPRDDSPLRVRVIFHIVRASDRTGGVDPALIPAELDNINAALSAPGLRFVQDGPIRFINSDRFYDLAVIEDIDVLRARFNVPGAVNLFYIPDRVFFCGVSSFSGDAIQGIIIKETCVNTQTTPHEVGHYFDLYHTHETFFGLECPDGSNCATAGDLLCDTPADPDLRGDVGRDCTYIGTHTRCRQFFQPDMRNLMSYSDNECRDHLTPQQYQRVVAVLLAERADHIIADCQADLDGDGVLTIFDFLAFQNLFDMGDPIADFDGDGSLTLFDFLAFQNAFDAGCP